MTRRRRRRGCRRPQGTPRGSSVVSRPRRWSRRRWGIRAPEPGARPSRSSTSSPPSARPPREPCRPTATRATVRGGGAWPRLNDDRRDDAAGSIGTHTGGREVSGRGGVDVKKRRKSNLMRQVDVQSRKERPRTLIVAGLPSTDAVASIETMHTSHRPRAGVDDGPISVHALSTK